MSEETEGGEVLNPLIHELDLSEADEAEYKNSFRKQENGVVANRPKK